jgi:hypothetical protein
MHACVCALRNSPSAYTLRHGREDGTDALRTWELQGSQDGKVLSLSCSAPLLSASLTSPLLQSSRTFIHPHVNVRAHGHGSALGTAHLCYPHGSLCAIATSLRRGETPPPPARFLVR